MEEKKPRNQFLMWVRIIIIIALCYQIGAFINALIWVARAAHHNNGFQVADAMGRVAITMCITAFCIACLSLHKRWEREVNEDIQ